MKKTFTLLLALTIASAAFAERKWGIEAGYDHNWLISKTSYQATTLDGETIKDQQELKATVNLDGFHVGGTFLYCFDEVEGLAVGGGIQYQFARGAVQQDQVRALIFDLTTKSIEQELAKCEKLTYTMHSLQIPLRIGYEYTFDNDLGIFAYAGPILNFALDWYIQGETADGYTATLHQISGVFVGKQGDSQTTKSDNDYKHYNIFDLGLGVAVGLSYKWVYFSAGCDVGLLNICSHPSYSLSLINTRYDIDNTARNIQLKLALGFRF